MNTSEEKNIDSYSKDEGLKAKLNLHLNNHFLDELLNKITKENLHGEYDFGESVGKEIC